MKKNIFFLSFLFFSTLNITAETLTCFPDLPNPVVRVQDIIIDDFGSSSTIEYTFPIFNVDDYPYEMFGFLPGSFDSRMAIEVYDANDNMLTSLIGLDKLLLQLAFLQVSVSECPPTEMLYLQVVDRLCDIRYTSNMFNAWSCLESDAHNYLDPNPSDCSCETCYDGIQNGDESGIDCGGQICPDCPEVFCRNVDVYINLNEPDYETSYFNRIWLKSAFTFIDFENSTVPYGSYIAKIRRHQNFINYDWTTLGAGIDGTPNAFINNNDKGKSFRSCLPISFFDIWRDRKYRLKLQQDFGSSDINNSPEYFCNGTFRTLLSTPGTETFGCIVDQPVIIGTPLYSAPAIHYTAIAQSDPSVLSRDETIEIPDESIIEAQQMKSITEIIASPNPGVSVINLQWVGLADERIQIVITNAMGRTLSANQVNGKRGNNELILDADHLQQGLHFIMISTRNMHNTVKWVKVE